MLTNSRRFVEANGTGPELGLECKGLSLLGGRTIVGTGITKYIPLSLGNLVDNGNFTLRLFPSANRYL